MHTPGLQSRYTGTTSECCSVYLNSSTMKHSLVTFPFRRPLVRRPPVHRPPAVFPDPQIVRRPSPPTPRSTSPPRSSVSSRTAHLRPPRPRHPLAPVLAQEARHRPRWRRCPPPPATLAGSVTAVPGITAPPVAFEVVAVCDACFTVVKHSAATFPRSVDPM